VIAMKLLLHALALRMLGTGPGAIVRPPDPLDLKVPAIVEPQNDLPRECRLGAVCVHSLQRPDQGWEGELTAHFSRRSVRGTILVLAYDLADPGAMARREVTMMWMIDGDPMHQISLQVPFERDAGFLPHHNYRVRFVQLLRGHEVVLAQGDIHLE
jgi:hypothetical protein